MKKLVLFAAFFSIVCFGSCNKKHEEPAPVENSTEEQPKVSTSTDNENNNQEEVLPSGESKENGGQSSKGGE